jgi:hypothetical protein
VSGQPNPDLSKRLKWHMLHIAIWALVLIGIAIWIASRRDWPSTISGFAAGGAFTVFAWARDDYLQFQRHMKMAGKS